MHISVGQALHLEQPHFWLPGGLQTGGLSSALTRRSFGTTEGSHGMGWYCLLQLFREDIVMFPGDAPYYPSYACCQFFFTQLPVQDHKPQ